MSAAEWDCEAYGAKGTEIGVLCFVGPDAGRQRRCPSRDACRSVMWVERRRVFAKITELAAAGDELGVILAGEFSSPDQLLGGSADT
jgi:hypothetical protein